MRASVRWLRELLPGLDASASELAQRFTAAGLAVDEIIPIGDGFDPIVVAKVLETAPHPKRDKLTLVTVDHGGARQTVVCGAANVPPPGGLVALAPVGTKLPTLPGPLEAREIAGVPSAGMLVSEAELGFSAESEGILILPEGAAAAGTKLADFLPCTDTLFEIAVTPNRPDALGHVGLARELGALYGLRFSPPDRGVPERTADAKIEDLISIDVRDAERCPHYGAAAVLDVRIAPSPTWLRWRLHSLGVRPISNVVDVTNLLLLEFGQPMHAFDLDLVFGGKIIVRRAAAGEAFTTLDGVARSLDGDDLVIADGERATALAGVMGGQASEIRESTKRVLLECAYFAPRGVRRTGRRHGLHTESSFRFERGVDRGAVPRVLDRAKALLVTLAGGSAVSGAVHVRAPEPERKPILLRSTRLDALLGTEVPFDEAIRALDGLGFERASGTMADPEVEYFPVSFRPDVSREVDLVEEVARVRGLDRIPTVLPRIRAQSPRTTGALERAVTAEAVALGLSEALTYAFVSPRDLEALHAPPPTVRLENPLTEERSVLRTCMLPGLLEALQRARRRGERDVRLFAVGARFLSPSDAPRSADAMAARPALADDARHLPRERPSFAAILAGTRGAWLGAQRETLDAFDAKGVAIEIAERLTGRTASVGRATGRAAEHLHPRSAGTLLMPGPSGTEPVTVGLFGTLHPDVVDAFDLGGPAEVVEIDLVALEAVGRTLPKYSPIPRLPAVTRDVSVVVQDAVLAGDVAVALGAEAGDLCESVSVHDLYRGAGIPDGHRSLTLRLVYRDPKAATDPDHARTLTEEEVDKHHQRAVAEATKKLGASVR